MTTPCPSPTGKTLSLAPFRGVRYAPEKVSSLAAVMSPPYDVVVHPDGRRHLEIADPHNVVRLILPHCADPVERHALAGRTMRMWQRDGVLTTDPTAALYAYEQREGALVQRGVIGALALDSPVLPHENVMSTTVADRAGLMRATSANLEPLLLTYRGRDAAGRAADDTEHYASSPTGANPVFPAPNHSAEKGRSAGLDANGTAFTIEQAATRVPLLTITTEDGIQHRLWAITDPTEINDITNSLAGHQALIADGHHRWATYQLLREERSDPSPWDHGLVLLVDSERYPLRVRAIHRVLYQLPISKALDTLSDAFRVQRIAGALPQAMDALTETATSSTNAFLLTGEAENRFYLLTDPDPALIASTLRTDRPEAWRRLDATVLHHLLLNHLWNVPDTPEHIGYLHDTTAAELKARRARGTAVLMRPVKENVVRHLAQQGVMMPSKSTSFGPKPATGLVLRDLTLV